MTIETKLTTNEFKIWFNVESGFYGLEKGNGRVSYNDLDIAKLSSMNEVELNQLLDANYEYLMSHYGRFEICEGSTTKFIYSIIDLMKIMFDEIYKTNNKANNVIAELKTGRDSYKRAYNDVANYCADYKKYSHLNENFFN